MENGKLDILIPTFNRPAKLHKILKSALAMNVDRAFFVVIDDHSTVSEEVPGLGYVTATEVCQSFSSEKIIYMRNHTNLGLTASLELYYTTCDADYTMLVNDKDEFINREPIVNALQKLDSNQAISLVMIPLHQFDHVMDNRQLLFDYKRMTSAEFIERYVRDNNLQHCGMYGAIRVAAIRKTGVPRSLNLRKFGLEDAFGFDIDFLLMIASTGDVDFESQAHVRRSIVGGLTERYPLTFAYCYYQYAMRVMIELRQKGLVTGTTLRYYLKWWILLIIRGLVVAYRPVHGTELEPKSARIQPHMGMPILLYIPLQCLKFRIIPTQEMLNGYKVACRLILRENSFIRRLHTVWR